ncbi:hypothetical protein BDQ17DRAFT_165988 [Cyathus striatus]|nr:hypothetical protein BDQ17DRAFT_165988 [Cyathus striatus]
MLRVSALYGHTRIVIVFMLVRWMIQTSATFGTLTYLLIKVVSYVYAVPLGGCVVLLPPGMAINRPESAIICIRGPCLSISPILFLMTLSTFWHIPIEQDMGTTRWKRIKLYPLLLSVLTDGTVFFFLIFISDLIMTIQDCANTPLTAKGTHFRPWIVAIRSVAGSRLILNLRRITRKSTNSRRHYSSVLFAQLTRIDNKPEAIDPL